MLLKDRVAVITGSGRGIGRGIALALAAQGCHVAINFFRKREDAEQTAEEAAAFGVRTAVIKAHLGNEEDVLRLVDEAAENNIVPLIEAVEAILLQLSNRDAVGFDEKYVKAVFASLLYPTKIYTIHSEYETNRRYVDLLLTRRPPIEPNYQFAFELKYLKVAEADQLETVKAEALQQMQGYLQHEKLRTLSDLRAWVVVFVGAKAQVVLPVEVE